jgi:hypothetical protein
VAGPTVVDVDEIEPSPDVTDEPGDELPRPDVYRVYRVARVVPTPSAEDMATAMALYGDADEVPPAWNSERPSVAEIDAGTPVGLVP